MREYVGFTRWDGGEAPLPIGTQVRVMHRDGSSSERTIEGYAMWAHLGTPCDIVAYRVIGKGAAWRRPSATPLHDEQKDGGAR